MLIEYRKSDHMVIGLARGVVTFVELPETSESCVCIDNEIAAAIWFSHVNGGEVLVDVDEAGQFVTAEIEQVEYIEIPPPKSPEQSQIERFKVNSFDTMLGVTGVYEIQTLANIQREQETNNVMVGVSEAHDLILKLTARIDALESVQGGG
ncbi:hypothetical protein [Paenibacillus sinopodophylli]|uniref:hypothetical protein n=1 Tax=Paenibacillus sinopodophylli TaxID=1837342 RepID=UPI00110CDBA8|nr:hypothetical protein [Paenibacillus sinopodophylli]